MQTDTQGKRARASPALEGVPATFRALTTCSAPPADHQKLCYSALILAMVFSMGEQCPTHTMVRRQVAQLTAGSPQPEGWDPLTRVS